jgi:hypothetical protein
MVRTKAKKATSGEGGNHLTIHRYDDGTVDMKWNWDALVKEVQIATGDRMVQYIDAGDLTPAEAVTLIKDVEAKVKKTRAKKSK